MIVVKFEFEKATKNTYRFKEEVSPGEHPIIGTLYVNKSVIGAVPPRGVKVTIEPFN